MEEVVKLLEEGRHVEFVEQLNDLEDNIRDARRNRNKSLEEELKREKRKIMEWCGNYVKNKEVPLQEQELVDLSCVLGVYLVKSRGLKTTQIRKVLEKFNEIEGRYKKDMKNFKRADVIKLKPVLAYTSARNEQSRELVRVLDNSINKIRDGEEGFEDFEKICEFLRGVVAYHRLAGGSD